MSCFVCTAPAGVTLIHALWRKDLTLLIHSLVISLIFGVLSFFFPYRFGRPLYVIEGERLYAGPLVVDFNHQEHILSVNSKGKHRIEFVMDDMIPIVIDLYPLSRKDRSYITEFISARMPGSNGSNP